MTYLREVANKKWVLLIILATSFGMLGYLLVSSHELDPINLSVKGVGRFKLLESKWAYFYLHLVTVFPVLFLSFDRRVAYYKNWKFLWKPILMVGLGFIIWDVFFTVYGVWGFNSRYLSGIHILFLPLEEWLFFVTVPFACVFIYLCLNSYFPNDSLDVLERWITYILTIIFIVVAILNYELPYTFLAFGLSGLFLIFHQWYGTKYVRKRFYLSYIIVLIPFLIINGVLTGSWTEEPIVAYSENAFMGRRIFTIPVEDAVYGFLLLISVVTGFEKLRERKS